MSPQTTRRGFSVHVFAPSGDPSGIKVIEKDNWTGRGLVIPRAMFAEARARDELSRTGVYLLVGPSESFSLPMLYLGEGDPVRPRLDQHASKKDFWTHAVVFTSKDQNLNKAHVQHLESRLVSLARSAKRTVLDNGNEPKPPTLSEADTAAVESFLDDVLLCLPILGFSYFDATPDSAPSTIELLLRAKGIEAKGYETAAGFVVRKGSAAVGEDKLTPSMQPFMKSLRDELIRSGVLAPNNAGFSMTQDYVFSSPSTAAAVCLARNANGRTEWKTAEGRSLKDIQESATRESGQ